MFYGSDWCSIIGRRTPKSLDKSLEDLKKAEKYQKRYDELIAKYITQYNPPSDDEKE